jgi:3-deoxy-7-phosphoheptulonate synthase
MGSARRRTHHFLSVTKQGGAAIVSTRGVPMPHDPARRRFGPELQLRRRRARGRRSRAQAARAPDDRLRTAGRHQRQPLVVSDIAGQVGDGSQAIIGVMLESFLVDGSQNHEKARGALVYGQSITDKCMSWERTEPLFTELAEAVRKRRG